MSLTAGLRDCTHRGHGDDARGVAAHDHRAAGKRGPADLDGFVQRDAVGDGADLFDARVEGLKHGVLGELGRHEQHGDVGGVVLYAPADGMVHRVPDASQIRRSGN